MADSSASGTAISKLLAAEHAQRYRVSRSPTHVHALGAVRDLLARATRCAEDGDDSLAKVLRECAERIAQHATGSP